MTAAQGRIAIAALAALAISAAAAQGQGQPKWADPAKTLRVMLPVAETGFDPQASGDYYSNVVNSAMFEALYEWDYLARPHRLRPRTATALPEISADGLTLTIHIKPGIRFADDPVFKGAPRELTAHDYVYSWKRILDPKVRSPNIFLLRGKFVDLDDAAVKAKASGRFDYDAPVAGLQAVDRYTLQLRLTEPDYTFLPILASTQLAAVAREVIEAYGDASGWAQANPVGTGPYTLKEWRRGQKIVLEANPNYREETFPPPPANADAVARAAARAMAGKRMPQIGRVEVSIIEESNPALLAFNAGDLDVFNVPRDHALKVIDAAGRLLPGYAKEGIALQRAYETTLAWFTYFEMNDPTVGGYTPEKIALRRAVLMGFDVPGMVRVALQGQGAPATQLIPPDVPGHVPGLSPWVPFDPALARALLDKFGYKDRDRDGFRETPDGKPLTLMIGSATSSEDRIRDELWQKSMRDIGLRVDFVKQKWPDLLKMARAGKLPMWQVGWNAQSSGPFLQLCYGPAGGETNLGHFRNEEYDALYRQSLRTPDAAEQARLAARMMAIVTAYAPLGAAVYRIENTLVQPWVQGYVKSTFSGQVWRFLDLDRTVRKTGK
jgi:oligopeptide transport system substrate-binding protein